MVSYVLSLSVIIVIVVDMVLLLLLLQVQLVLAEKHSSTDYCPSGLVTSKCRSSVSSLLFFTVHASILVTHGVTRVLSHHW